MHLFESDFQYGKTLQPSSVHSERLMMVYNKSNAFSFSSNCYCTEMSSYTAKFEQPS